MNSLVRMVLIGCLLVHSLFGCCGHHDHARSHTAPVYLAANISGHVAPPVAIESYRLAIGDRSGGDHVFRVRECADGHRDTPAWPRACHEPHCWMLLTAASSPSRSARCSIAIDDSLNQTCPTDGLDSHGARGSTGDAAFSAPRFLLNERFLL